MPFIFPNPTDEIPGIGNPELAKRGFEDWIEKVGQPLADETAKNPAVHKLLSAIFGNSPFLTFCILKESEFFLLLLRHGPDVAYAHISDILSNNSKQTLNDADLSRLLRVCKRQVALLTASADISGVWPLEKITQTLSEFAGTALSLASSHLLRQLASKGAFTLKNTENPEVGSGLVILGMGKLGAFELNYSSDIDLIVLYDPECIDTEHPEAIQNHFVRLARGLIKLIDERTADGYVFRTDLRLRPDPSATPLAVSVLAAETYYESLGQNWERAAMIKARPVAGDIEAGERFLKWLTPFIWRKNLDFAAIQDIHSIKRQINAHRGGSEIAIAGHNVKLGAGGIREVEFFAQTQQLIWGGREADLRSPFTLEAIKKLTQFGLCAEGIDQDMIAAYEFLRRVEHRIQMVNDEQTHILPASPDELSQFSIFLGYPDTESFSTALRHHLETVLGHYSNLFADSPSLTAAREGEQEGSLVFTGSYSDPETMETIRNLGYQNPETVDTTVRSWHHGRHRATRSTRAREILTELMPTLLSAIGSTPDPDTAFLRFDKFIAGLPSGVQLFSMFHSNPHLLTLVAVIIGESPRLAEHLSHRPSVLDSVLTPGFFDPLPNRDALEEELSKIMKRAEHMEDMLNTARRWCHDRRFQVGVQRLQNLIKPALASEALSKIAETVLKSLYQGVFAEFMRIHGALPGGEIAIIGYGKLGSREMTAASDLDLVFVYRCDEDATASDGEKPLAPTQYFSRLSQRLITAYTVLTPEGTLYEIDMRLRPSGNSGPIACTLGTFKKYQTDEAWTWEHMALTRARVIVASPKFQTEVEETITQILTTKREPEKLLLDVASMRQRLAKEKGTDCIWALKHFRGGLVDVEFIVQYLILRHAEKYPEITRKNTENALLSLNTSGLIDAETQITLTSALKLWHGILGLLALTVIGTMKTERNNEICGALADDLIKVSDANDFTDLENKIRATASAVLDIFQNLIETPAEILRSNKDQT